MPTITPTVVVLDDDLRDLMRELTGYAGAQLEGADTAAGTAELDEFARKLAFVRALWTAAETGRLAREYLADIVLAVHEERDYCADELPRECDHLRTFIIREEPGLRYHDDRSETIATYRNQIARYRRYLGLSERFLELVA